MFQDEIRADRVVAHHAYRRESVTSRRLAETFEPIRSAQHSVRCQAPPVLQKPHRFLLPRCRVGSTGTVYDDLSGLSLHATETVAALTDYLKNELIAKAVGYWEVGARPHVHTNDPCLPGVQLTVGSRIAA